MEAGQFYTDEINALIADADRAIALHGAAPEVIKKRGLEAKRQIKLAVAKLLKIEPKSCRWDSDHDALDDVDADDYSCDSLIVVAGPGIRTIVKACLLADTTEPRRISKAFDAWVAKGKALCSERCRVAELASTAQVNAFKARLRAVHGKLPESVATLRTSFNEWLRMHAPHTCPA